MRIAIFAAMDASEQDHRLWFVVDELDALGAIDGLKDALARIRKFGGRCVLGLQTVARSLAPMVRGSADHRRELRQHFYLSLLGQRRRWHLGFASTLIGQREVRRPVYSFSQRHTELFGSSTRSEHTSVEPAVMDSQIEQIPDLCGYLKLASRPEWLMVSLAPPVLAARSRAETPAFVPVSLATAATSAPAPVPATKNTAPKRRARAKAANAATAAAPAPAPTPARAKRSARAPRTSAADGPSSTPRAPDSRGFEP